MEHLRFEQIDPKNKMQCECFKKMMYAYSEELGGMEELCGEQDIAAVIEKWVQSILRLLGPSDRHLELCWLGDQPAGFLYGKVDHEEHRGFVKPGYGYVMEFYVAPLLRRKGIGTAMLRHLESCFKLDGATQMYLTTDTNEGIAFWQYMGFVNTHEKCPENQTEIYEKTMD